MPRQFILIRNENYFKKLSGSLLRWNFTIFITETEKPQENSRRNKIIQPIAASDREIVEKRVLKSLTIMKPWQLEKSKPIHQKVYDDPDISINEKKI